jgi:hypothetical protein
MRAACRSLGLAAGSLLLCLAACRTGKPKAEQIIVEKLGGVVDTASFLSRATLRRLPLGGGSEFRAVSLCAAWGRDGEIGRLQQLPCIAQALAREVPWSSTRPVPIHLEIVIARTLPPMPGELCALAQMQVRRLGSRVQLLKPELCTRRASRRRSLGWLTCFCRA